MLTSKQRSQLRAMANGIDTILIVGKDGITPAVAEQAAGALKARELIKGRVLETSLLPAREACELLAERCHAEPVQCIGSKFVLYKRNETDPKIELVKSKKIKRNGQ